MRLLRSLYQPLLLGALMGLISFLFRPHHEPTVPLPPPPITSEFTLDGVHPGMLMEQVHQALGAPQQRGTRDGGVWERYAEITIVTYHPNSQVLEVAGQRLRGTNWVLDVGDPAIFPTPLGAPIHRDQNRAEFRVAAGILHFELDPNGKIAHIRWTGTPAAR